MNTEVNLVQSAKGLVNRRIFHDPEIYARELDRIFARCWLYVGHESQIPNPGDYITNYMGEDAVVVWRGLDNRIRVFLNSCRHRGMKVCRQDRGNTRVFVCSFHGWTYSTTGELTRVPLEEAYEGGLNTKELGLLEVPKVANYRGLVFACWDAGAVSLETYLGDLKWYLDILISRPLGGLTVIEGQQRYRAAANWKLAGENFAGDNYHLPHSHGSVYRLNIRQVNLTNPIVSKRPETYYNVAFDHGHGVTGLVMSGARYEADQDAAAAMGKEVLEYVNESNAKLRSLLSEKQAAIYGLAFGNMFPNFSFNDFSALRPTGFYLWHPKGPAVLESYQWCAIDSAAPQVLKNMMQVDFTRTQAISGLAAQDDTENFEQVTEATRGVVCQRLDFNYQMGLKTKDSFAPAGFPGRFAPYFSENNQNNFYGYWSQLMDERKMAAAAGPSKE